MADCEPARPSLPLDYESPPPIRPRQWRVADRLALGIFLCVAYYLALGAVIYTDNGLAFKAMLFPMYRVAELVDAYQKPGYSVPRQNVVPANALFWGFSIAFAIGRRRGRKG